MAQHDCFVIFFLALPCLCIALPRHECERPCFENASPKKCFYDFSIGISRRAQEKERNSENKLFLSINKKWPGPKITVCQNDLIIVKVNNRLPFGMETALHWYGLAEHNSPFMDGVPLITQCPIFPHMSFQYQIRASKAGTFYYRAHSIAQQQDGIFGPLVISSEKDQIYPSQTIVISAELNKIQSLNSNYEAELNVTSFRFEVYYDECHACREDNERQRLRIINAAALNCPVTLYTHTVPVQVVALDGNEVKPRRVNKITVQPGERVDLLVKREIKKVIHTFGHNLCDGHIKYGLKKGNSQRNSEKGKEIVNLLIGAENKEEFESAAPNKLEKNDLTIFLPFDATEKKFIKGVVDFRYKFGTIIASAPSYLSTESGTVIQVQNKSFLYPSSPMLSQLQDVPKDIFCSSENFSDKCSMENTQFCECLNVVNLKYNKSVDLFLIDEGKNSNESQTVYIHGYSFQVLSSKSYGKPIHWREVKEDEYLGKIPRNLVNIIKKDTVVVPNKGFVVIRLETNNPGKWLMESTTSKARTGSGLEIILNVEDEKGELLLPENFPKCGTMKPPDVVLSDD